MELRKALEAEAARKSSQEKETDSDTQQTPSSPDEDTTSTPGVCGASLVTIQTPFVCIIHRESHMHTQRHGIISCV